MLSQRMLNNLSFSALRKYLNPLKIRETLTHQELVQILLIHIFNEEVKARRSSEEEIPNAESIRPIFRY